MSDPLEGVSAVPVTAVEPGPISWRALYERAQTALVRHARRVRIVVGAGGCARAVGADQVIHALREAIAARGLPARVIVGGCNGMCHAATLATVGLPHGATFTYTRVTPETAPLLIDQIQQERVPEPLPGGEVFAACDGEGRIQHSLDWLHELPFNAGQRRVLLGRCGLIDATDIDDAILYGAYRTFARVLESLEPEAVIEEVRRANLLGRGGAYFPAAVKWESARRAPDRVKYLVVNAEEGEPGIFKDRHLIEGDPHQLLEGVLIAAYAIGARFGYLFVNGEGRLARHRLELAVEQARARGLLGERILGSDFRFDLEIRRGAGGYILGEETALLEAIEGNRAMPRVKPPFPAERGLWGHPTVINNTETLCNLPHILARGAEWFQAIGSGRARGTKLVGLSGCVARPGLAEIELGTPLRAVVEGIGGGVADGRPLVALVTGGPSGTLVSPRVLDEPTEPGRDWVLGSGGITLIDDRLPVIEVLRRLTRFNAHESCGKCTPCREGSPHLLELLQRWGTADAQPGDHDELLYLADVVQLASLCGLGQMAPNPIRAALAHFGEALATVPAPATPGGSPR